MPMERCSISVRPSDGADSNSAGKPTPSCGAGAQNSSNMRGSEAFAGFMLIFGRVRPTPLTMRSPCMAPIKMSEIICSRLIGRSIPIRTRRRRFEGLRDKGIRTAILSNGTTHMLQDALAHADLDEHREACISIEDAGVYKPSPAAYRLATARLGLEPKLVGFVSSNAWDIAGAQAFGSLPVWVNRDALPDEYALRSTVFEAPTLAAAGDCFEFRERESAS